MFRNTPEQPAADPANGHRVLALANQKGGVGKTTTAINLGTALAAVGERVLIVDLDPQGNASTGLGISREDRDVSTYEVLLGDAPLGSALAQSTIPRLDCVPSTMDLLGAELELAQSARRTHRLHDAVEAYYESRAPDDPLQPAYTYILVDCPPSLNLLTINAMAAANSLLVPLQCEFFALEGLSQLLKTGRAGQSQSQSAPEHPRHRADHVRRTQFAVRSGRRRRPFVSR